MANDAHTDSRRNKTSSEPVGEALLLSVSQFLQASHSERHTPLEIYVAYSGGLDSSVLLHAAAKHLRNNGIASAKLSAVHVNHHLSQHASQWALHCEQQAKALGIDFHCMDVHLPQRSRSSLEAQARDARYQAINDKVPKGSLVLLAQHQDDQAETFLLQLLRGSGPHGLSAMPSQSQKVPQKVSQKVSQKISQQTSQEQTQSEEASPQYLRPLLGLSRTDLDAYAKAHSLTWIEDESNQDEGFARNYLRHQLMPILEKKWPSAAHTISRSAQHCSAYAQGIDEYMSLLAQNCVQDKDFFGQTDTLLSVRALKTLSANTQFLMLRHWIKLAQDALKLTLSAKRMPSTGVLKEMLSMCEARKDAKAQCEWGDCVVRLYQEHLYLERRVKHEGPTYEQASHKQASRMQDHHASASLSIAELSRTQIKESDSSIDSKYDSEDEYTLEFPSVLHQADTALVTRVTLTAHVNVNELSPIYLVYGDLNRKCRMHDNRPSKAVKDWLREWGIPPWRRRGIGMLIQNDEILILANVLREGVNMDKKKPTQCKLAVVGNRLTVTRERAVKLL